MLRRRLLAAAVGSLMAMGPLMVRASSGPDVNALWNQPDGVPVDSAFYVVQTWWNRLNLQIPDDPTQRGLQELSQANTELLSVHTLLDAQRTNPDPQPVPLLDPLVSTVYNAVTGSNITAPLGSLADSVNQWLLNLEGRGTRTDIVRGLLLDYRIKQAAASRDLAQKPTPDLEALLAANAERENAWLARVQTVGKPAQVGDLVKKADQSTTALAAHVKSVAKGESPGKDDASGKNDSHSKDKKPKKN